MKRAFVTTTAAITLMAAPAFAIVAEIDTNGDGVYTLAEVQSAMPEMTAETFATLDVNADGLLDADEVAAAVEAGVIPDTAS